MNTIGYQCLCCGGPLAYSGSSGRLECGACGNSYDMEASEIAGGATATGKFCPECGAKKPAGLPIYQCDKCGWKPADPTKAPKFCPECGDVFDEGDIQ